LINSHGREEELLFFATSILDHAYALNYWITKENWAKAVEALKLQTSPEIFYKSASVMLSHVPQETVSIWIQQQRNLDLTKLTPALLNYNSSAMIPLSENQAVRYLIYAINQLGDTTPSVHNAIISIYASHPSSTEDFLLNFLKAQPTPPYYDVDFTLRLCLQFKRIQSAVHIYSTMDLFEQAVSLALDNEEVELAIQITETLEDDLPRCKKLWITIVQKLLTLPDGMKRSPRAPRPS
jgi:vacuolar protein sorting-associated protein 18